MKDIIKTYLEKANLKTDEKICNDFDKYHKLLEEWNQKFNLTRITEKHEVAVKHFIDSIIPENLIPENSKVIDIGAGAGFPSIPLKIYRPDLNLTMVDSLNKRITFLNEVVSALNLNSSQALHSRSEDLAHNKEYREQYDIALARAVAPLNTLCEYCLPFVKVNGYFLAYKAFDCDDEIKEAEKAIQILGGRIEKIYEYSTSEEIKRKIIVVKKIENTGAKYPRGKNLPKTAPLV